MKLCLERIFWRIWMLPSTFRWDFAANLVYMVFADNAPELTTKCGKNWKNLKLWIFCDFRKLRVKFDCRKNGFLSLLVRFGAFGVFVYCIEAYKKLQKNIFEFARKIRCILCLRTLHWSSRHFAEKWFFPQFARKIRCIWCLRTLHLIWRQFTENGALLAETRQFSNPNVFQKSAQRHWTHLRKTFNFEDGEVKNQYGSTGKTRGNWAVYQENPREIRGGIGWFELEKLQIGGGEILFLCCYVMLFLLILLIFLIFIDFFFE